MYMNALDRARIHTPELHFLDLSGLGGPGLGGLSGLLRGRLLCLLAGKFLNGRKSLALRRVVQPEQDQSTPRRPAQACSREAPFPTKAATMEPTNMEREAFARLCEALKNP